MRKTIYLLLVCCAAVWSFAFYLRYTDDAPEPGIEHRETNLYPESYSDRKNYPYYKYDTIRFTDGSSAVMKLGIAPMNMEGIIKDNKGRIVAVCSGGSEVVPVYQLPRYDKKGHMTELLQFSSHHSDSTEVAFRWSVPDALEPDMALLRQQMDGLEYKNLKKEMDTQDIILYNFDYRKGRLMHIRTDDGDEIVPDEGHYLKAALLPEEGFWGSDISGASHRLVVEQLPVDENADTYVYQRYVGMQIQYDTYWVDGQIRSMHFYGPDEDYRYRLLETVTADYPSDTTVYTHSYRTHEAYMRVYWHDGRQVKVEKYNEAGEMEDAHCYEYLPDKTVNLSHLVYGTNNGQLKELSVKRMKVWDDLFDTGEKPGMTYVQKVSANYAEYF